MNNNYLGKYSILGHVTGSANQLACSANCSADRISGSFAVEQQRQSFQIEQHLRDSTGSTDHRDNWRPRTTVRRTVPCGLWTGTSTKTTPRHCVETVSASLSSSSSSLSAESSPKCHKGQFRLSNSLSGQQGGCYKFTRVCHKGGATRCSTLSIENFLGYVEGGSRRKTLVTTTRPTSNFVQYRYENIAVFTHSQHINTVPGVFMFTNIALVLTNPHVILKLCLSYR